jgi:predicted Zn finger-like uncharacterized protein
MELICPSCEARYQVPERAIGEKGRQVSCLNCGHSWHAYPPLVLKSPASAQKSPPPWQAAKPAHAGGGEADGAQDWLGPAAVGASAAAQQGTGGPGAARSLSEAEPPASEDLEPFAPPPPSASRSDQLAEIREMLAEVQSEDRAAAALNPAPEQGGGAAAGAKADPSSRGRVPVEAEPGQTPPSEPQGAYDQHAADAEMAIRDKLNIADVRAMAPKPPDPKRLRRAHERKETKRRRREAAGSGALTTCFLLVVMIAAVMISLYLLHQPIIEKVPSLAGPLEEYVATIDSWRVGIAETFAGLSGWVTERLGESV